MVRYHRRRFALSIAVAATMVCAALAEGEEDWVVEERKREEAVLGESAAAIEKHRMSPAEVTVVDEDGTPLPGVTVNVELTRHDFLFGCNIYMFDRYETAEENEAYRQRFEDLFNYATVGFYWSGYERERGKPNYPYTDKVVAWCEERGIRMKGHPILWDHKAGVPPWSNGQPPPEVQRQRVVDILQRYEGRIAAWEVVNEPAHCKAIAINEPYRWAREASPDSYLIVNDYRVLANGCKPFYELLGQALKDGVPFDGIGIQAHEPRVIAFALGRVQDILDSYAALGKELHITEFTPCSNGLKVTGGVWRGTWDEAVQADYAEDFYRVCFGHPAVVAITWWDLCDNGSWLENGGMLCADLTPKPVYETLRKLIHEEWRTNLEGKTDPDGRFAFSGFHGTYRVTAELDDKEVQAEFHLAKTGRNEFTVILP